MSYYSSTFFSSEQNGFDQTFYAAPHKSIHYEDLSGDYYQQNHPPTPTYQSAMSYFVTNPYFVDHRSVAPYGGSDTDQFVVSYSISQLTETDDVEYDPTPYGGGYDLELTYGKPLPPSDEICHPRSLPGPNPNPSSQIESSVDLPKWKEPQIAQEEEAAPKQAPQEILPQPQPQPPSDDDVGGGDDSGAIVVYYGDDNYNNYPWGGGYDCDGNVGESPFGCNPDAMEFCESLFGYWPCLHHRKQPQSYGPDTEAEAEAEAVAPDYAFWDSRSAADYLFGDSRHGEFGSQVHSSWL